MSRKAARRETVAPCWSTRALERPRLPRRQLALFSLPSPLPHPPHKTTVRRLSELLRTFCDLADPSTLARAVPYAAGSSPHPPLLGRPCWRSSISASPAQADPATTLPRSQVTLPRAPTSSRPGTSPSSLAPPRLGDRPSHLLAVPVLLLTAPHLALLPSAVALSATLSRLVVVRPPLPPLERAAARSPSRASSP